MTETVEIQIEAGEVLIEQTEISIEDGSFAIDEIGEIGPYIEDKTLCVTDPLGDALIAGVKGYLPVGQKLNEWRLYHVGAFIDIPSSVGQIEIQIQSSRHGLDILNNPIVIDVNEFSSYTSLNVATVNATYAQVLKGDILKPRVTVPGSGAKGLFVYFEFIR